MLRCRKLRRLLSLVCAFCMMFSLFTNGTIAIASDGETPQENAVVEQEAISETEAETTTGEVTTPPSEETADGREEEPPGEEAIPPAETETAGTETEAASAETETETEEETNFVETEPASEEETEAESDAPGEKPKAPARANRAASTSTDLTGFLTSVVIDAPVDDNGNYIINPNNTYEMTLKFSELENLQFEDEATLTYNFPNGVTVGDFGPTAFSITIVDENGAATVFDNTFEVVNGQLRVHFNQADPNFERLKTMPNVDFSLSIASSYDQNEGTIQFSPDIVKEFVYDNSADINITKNVEYDMDSDTASYVLQITSAGVNENVVIEDHLTGTALNFNQDVVIESNINGALSVTPDYSAVENGFRVTIPQTANGEVLTLRYTASVDNTKINGNGTVAQTNNTAQVKSDQVPDGKEASADFHGQVTFDRIHKVAAGDPVSIGNNQYEQTWTISVNQDHKIPLGGTYISDWIVVNSRPFMQFTGDGITVEVTLEGSNTTETREIPWSQLRLYNSDAYGTYGWGYLTPETDGKASYVITCKTIIDSSSAITDLTLENGAQIYSSYASGQTSVGVIGEKVFKIDKKQQGTTQTESDWKITVTVPGSGLPDLRVTDDLPQLEYNGQTYIDYFLDGSMNVEGLLDDESYRISFNETNRSFTVTFYKTGVQNDDNLGVLPTEDGQPRDIVLRFKTRVNQDWLDLAKEDNYTSETLYTHRNVASARSGDSRLPSVRDYVVPIKPDFEKSFVERTDAEVDGVTYPVFHYLLRLYGPVEDGIVIHDTFNTDYLKFYEADGVTIRGGKTSISDGNGSASAADTADGLDITVSRFPKNTNTNTFPHDFYPIYEIEYSLIAKDQAALEQLNEDAAASGTGVLLENTAEWNDLSSSAEFTYSYFPYVDKEQIARPTADNGYLAEFKVVINKYAEDLDPTADVLTIRDILSSNLRFIPDSVTISPAVDTIDVQHDSETNAIIFLNVPDETTFEITYQARVLGQGNVTYSNTVQFGKYEKTIEETTKVDSSGGGTASNPSITVVKRDAESLSTTLAGATFQLFYMQGDTRVPVTDRNDQPVTFTTGADGTMLIVGNLQSLGWVLWTGRTYCLVETVAPAGYELNTEPAYFVLSETPANQMEYDITGDQFSIQNTPEKISIPVSKAWIGPAADSVTVHLYIDNDGEQLETGKSLVLNSENNWSGQFEDLRKYNDQGQEIQYVLEEDPVANYESRQEGSAENGFTFTNTNIETLEIPVEKQWIGPAAEAVTVNLLADNIVSDTVELNADNEWKHTFTDLPKYDHTDGHEISYDVQETPLENYEPGRDGSVANGFTFTNTNIETLDIPVEKQWIGPAAEAVTVNLLADNVVSDTVELNADNEWKHTFTDLPKYDHTDGHEISYDVQEEPLENYEPGRDGSVANGFTFTNTNIETLDIPVEKQWIGPAAEAVTINLLADNTVIDSVELKEENEWKHTFTDLPKYDHTDGHEISYDVQETPLENYEPGRDGSVANGFTFTNTNIETLDIPVEKQWIGPAAETVTINLLADDVVSDTVELNADNEWKHTFTGLPKYDHTDGHEISYDVQEAPLENYESGRDGSVANGFTFTNTNIETLDIPVEKQWIGPAAEAVTIHLLADDAVSDTVELNAGNEWKHTFTDLPKYDHTDGHEISYDVQEDALENYESNRSGSVANGFTFTNTNIETLEIPVAKQWIGPAAEAVTVNLLADNAIINTVKLNAGSEWKHTFTDLPKYDHTDGHEISYDVQEVPLENYESGRDGSVAAGFTFTNTNIETLDIPVEKQWIGPAAEAVTVNLLADDTVIDSVELKEENGWKYTFTDLPKYDHADGHEISYDVQEDALENYESGRDGSVEAGFTFTNTNTETIEIPVTKRWVGTPLSSITIHLFADGEETGSAVLSKDTSWQHTFTDLPKYSRDDGHEIAYTITEDASDNYTTDITGDMENGFVVTNTTKTPSTPSTTPKTGDDSHLLFYFLTLLLSGGCLMWMIVKKRKRQL